MILLIDNYDSFSYNLYQAIGCINPLIKVVLNDGISLTDIEELAPSHIIISPGPGKPRDAGICELAIHCFAGKIPILGVCLGHEAICEIYGGAITYAKSLMHGKSSIIKIDTSCAIFKGLPDEIEGARYHSLAADAASLAKTPLAIIAQTKDGEVMAVSDEAKKVFGVQFHPESILTPAGTTIIGNFLQCV
jgi:anthranilate synthase component 2